MLGRFVITVPAVATPNLESYKPMESGYAIAGNSINGTIH